MRDDSNHISLVTKIRAMEGKLLTDMDYNNMHNMNSMQEVFNYLHEKEEYRDLLDSHEDVVELHRNQLEHLLVHSLYGNIIKIYKFAAGEERKFIDIIISRFEIDMLKKCIANLDNNHMNLHVKTYGNFFNKHSNIEFDGIHKVKDIHELAIHLQKSSYKKILNKFTAMECDKLSEYENALDIYYFTSVWNGKNRFNSDTEQIITHMLGSEIDLYNIKTIYRCKKFYHMKPDRISNYVVPVGYMLKKDELNDLINSDDVEEFLNLFNKTYYAKEEISFDIKNINASFERTLNKIHKNFVKKNPNSLARVYMYFDKKNYEIHYTTRIIENIRYRKINI